MVDRRRTLPPLVTVALLLAAAPAAAAPGAAAPESAYTHDGLLVRLALGFGYTATSLSGGGGGEIALTGGGGFGSIAIGGMLTRNVALNADLFGLTTFEPTVEVDGRARGELGDTRMTLGAVGLGLTYYLMPANVYFAGSFGAAIGTIETRGRILGVDVVRKAESDLGFAINLMIGKEWWVGQEWGIGVAGQLIFGRLPDGDATLGVFGVGVLFSATYN